MFGKVLIRFFVLVVIVCTVAIALPSPNIEIGREVGWAGRVLIGYQLFFLVLSYLVNICTVCDFTNTQKRLKELLFYKFSLMYNFDLRLNCWMRMIWKTALSILALNFHRSRYKMSSCAPRWKSVVVLRQKTVSQSADS